MSKYKTFWIHNTKRLGEVTIKGDMLFAGTEMPIGKIEHEVIEVIERRSLDEAVVLLKDLRAELNILDIHIGNAFAKKIDEFLKGVTNG